MYRNALLSALIGASATVGVALPSFSGTGLTEYHKHDNDQAAPGPEAEPLSTVQVKQLKASKKQAEVLYQAGLKFEKAGDFKNAQISYYKALMLRQKVYGKGDTGIYILTNRLGDVGLKRKDWEYADKCFKELMNAQNKYHGPGDFATIPILLKLAQVEEGKRQLPAQINYLDRALSLQERKSGPNAPECLPIRLTLLAATINDGDWHDADERFQKAIDIENGKGSTKTREYLQLLKDGSKIKKALNKPSEAAEFDQKATELEAQLPPPSPPKTQAAEPPKSGAPAASAPPANSSVASTSDKPADVAPASQPKK